jgi:hypothetical protein
MGAMAVVGACCHLIVHPDVDFCQHFIGKGVDSWFLCERCDSAAQEGVAVDVAEIEESTARHIRAAGYCDGISGAPTITERPGPTLGPISETTLVGPRLHALAAMPGRALLAYNELQDIELLDDAPKSGTIDRRIVAHVGLEREFQPRPFRHPVSPRLIADPTGCFVAVVHDYGRFGAVVDLRNGRITMVLDGGDYHPNTVPFSACFVMHRGAPVLIHRTAWNRLEASDPATGRLMTERPSTVFERGQPQPEHYLDYFHGALLLSPSGTVVLDDGWIWHPFGDLTTFDVAAWLDRNPWETEDGDSLKSLLSRPDWDAGLVWVTDDLIALGHLFPPEHRGDGLGFLYRRSTGELSPIAGPTGRFFSDGVRLFTAGSDGLSVWNVDDGSRTSFLSGFSPTLQHSARGELIQLDGNRLLALTYGSNSVTPPDVS